MIERHQIVRAIIGLALTALLALGLAPWPAAAAMDGAAGSERAAPRATDDDAARYRPAGCATLTAAQRNSAVPVATCDAIGYTDAAGQLQSADDGPPAGALSPQDLKSAYRLPDGGAGLNVAIVDAYGYADAEEDLAVFRAHYGLPACTGDNGCFTKLDQRGGADYPTENSGWSIETALDLDAVSAVCPLCHITLVQADTAGFDDLAAAVTTAAATHPVAISNSYGYDGESPAQAGYDRYYDLPGIAVTVSSGDNGNVQSFPATSPYVTAVGGTRLTRDDSARGWHEGAWGSERGGSGAGSGCSLYEPMPAWQQDVPTTCGSHKATADVSADADPASGLGVYNTAAAGGWAQYGGTSLAAPLVAGMYALAGKPTPGTYPASYPYAASAGALNDVTDGANGSCGTKLCQGGPGWDGPTGLGTPNGVAALAPGATGELVGQVSDAATGTALSGASITATASDGRTFTATAGADGRYRLFAPVRTYTVTATRFGYEAKTATDVTLTADEPATSDFALTAVPSERISGQVSDGSGHGWPMRARITVSGHPDTVAYSDPYTGRYSLALPTGAAYRLHFAAADLPGYQAADLPVDLTGSASAASTGADVALKADEQICTAPGYAFALSGTSTDFEGWTGRTGQDGWTVTDGAGKAQTWSFDDPGGRGNLTGGAGNFAIVDSAGYGSSGRQNTNLVSPVVDLSTAKHPAVDFDQDYSGDLYSMASVDVTTNGGTSWTNLWRKALTDTRGHLHLALPALADPAHVQVRFNYLGQDSRHWELDNVLIGNRACAPVPGGLVAGTVTDQNTGKPVVGATIARADAPHEFGASVATADDANLPDGYYWLFSSHLGGTDLTVDRGWYAGTHGSADVGADAVGRKDFALPAGRLTVDHGSLSASVVLGTKATGTLTFGNDGTAPVHVQLAEQQGGFTPTGTFTAGTAARGPAKQIVKTHAEIAGLAPGDTAPEQTLRAGGAASGPWAEIADYPKAVMDNAVAHHDGRTYVVGGSNGSAPYDDANVYDEASRTWSAMAPLPEPLSGASAAFVGNTLYAVGGWNANGQASAHVYAYHPATDTWTRVANRPGVISKAGIAVVDGKVYVVAGCATVSCRDTAAVYSYDPKGDTWTHEADYPAGVAYLACGAAGGLVVCAGGRDTATDESLTATYAFAPGAQGWTRKADLPMDAWGAAAASANGRFQVIGGSINDGTAITNQGYSYDPATDTWTALPNANNAVFRGGAGCGIDRIGGSTGGFHPVRWAETLPGYDQCGADAEDVSWLGTDRAAFDVAPGRTVTVTVGFDSSAVAQPGDYQAGLRVLTDSPYTAAPVQLALHVDPPKSWAELAGTVTDAEGAPIAGATVQLCTGYDAKTGDCGVAEFTLKTDAAGRYQQWLDTASNAVAVIAASPGYQPRIRVVKLKRGTTTTLDISLTKA